MNSLYLSITTGILLGLAFACPTLFFLIFIAFVPLLFVEKACLKSANQYLFFNYSAIAFLIWNTISCWWIGSAHLLGGILIVVCNSLVQALVFWTISRVANKKNKPIVFFWILIWLGFEYFHSNWDLAWTWLHLGNVFSTTPKLIQWYEFTGTRGGSLWIILINYMLFALVASKHHRKKYILLSLFVFTLPLALSLYLYSRPISSEKKVSFVALQPNVDPYTNKFKIENQQKNYTLLLQQIDSVCMASAPDFIIAPETVILPFINEDKVEDSSEYQQLKRISNAYPDVKIIVGTHSTAHNKNYNSAMFLSPENTQFYHKHWLVPLFEQVPFQRHFTWLPKTTISLGGFSGTYSQDNTISHFKTDIAITPIVCYESIFGAYCVKRVPSESGFIALITNDGWWKNTLGYFYHFNFSRLRAIESRRDIVRVANNGISAHINSKGEIIKATNWWEKTTMSGSINCISASTFYSKKGDYLGRIALFFSLLLLASLFVKRKISCNN